MTFALAAKLRTANTGEHKLSGTTLSEIEVSAYIFYSVTAIMLLYLEIIVGGCSTVAKHVLVWCDTVVVVRACLK